MLQELLLLETLKKLPVFYYKVVFCNGRPLTRSSHASHFAQKSGGNKKKDLAVVGVFGDNFTILYFRILVCSM